MSGRAPRIARPICSFSGTNVSVGIAMQVVRFRCPFCLADLRIRAAEIVGLPVPCPECQTQIVVVCDDAGEVTVTLADAVKPAPAPAPKSGPASKERPAIAGKPAASP